MAIKPLPLPLESDPGRFGHDGMPRLINVYAEKRGVNEKSGKDVFAHYSVPGMDQWIEVTNGGACRGLFAMDPSLLLAVSGTAVVSVTPTGAQTFLGGLLGTKPVTFARNRKDPNAQAVLVSNGLRRIYEDGTLSTIDDSDLPPPICCDSLSAYILYGIADGRFFYSNLNEASSIAALAVYEAEGKPDGLVRLKVIGNQAWLFGTETTEFWGLTNNAEDPFERISGAYIDLGCLAPHSVVQVGQKLAWVANDHTVRIGSNYEPETISTPHIAELIETLSDPAAIEAHCFTIRQQQFLRISSPDWTWVRNMTSGFWHEEKSVGMERRRAAHYARFGGRHIVGDSASAKLYAVDASSGADGAGALISKIITAPIHIYPGEVEYNALFVDTIPGSGLNTPNAAQTLDPMLMVRDSDDGGKSWSSERALEIGRQGDSTKRVHTEQLGTSGEDGRVFEFAWDAAANKGITGAAVDAVAVSP